MKATLRNLFMAVLVSSSLISCKGVQFTFNGAVLDYDKVKTISVEVFPNYAPLAQPTLSQDFTEALRDIFLTQTRLDLVKNNGDLQFSGKIEQYRTAPVGIQADEVAAQNRLTITVFVKFVNRTDETRNFEKRFTQYADYNSTRQLNEVEATLIEEINELLVQEIFNASVGDW
ncbi:LptE family protein [bacterium SCSIO 12741]|nr:LptE family protein [bacterium SCSIO 12741]